MAWQRMFLVIAHDPVNYCAAMVPTIVEKLGFVIAIQVLYSLGQASGSIVGFAVLDAIWLLLLLFAYLRTLQEKG